MHVVVSISLATVAVRPVAPAGLPGVAEIALRRVPIMLCSSKPQRHRGTEARDQFPFFARLCALYLCGFHIFSMLTKNPLYSGVPEFGSNTLGLRLLMSGPVTRPTKPQ